MVMMKSNNIFNLFSFSVNALITSCSLIASRLSILNPYLSINSPKDRSTTKPLNRMIIAYKLLAWRKIVSTYSPKRIGIVKSTNITTIMIYFLFFSKTYTPLRFGFKSTFKKKFKQDNRFLNP